ncbi:DUF4876 domain-containing protein [Echinicola strongylocentroti]|uniref:DUF4876 domain-containing protein n=1 Tax=Echinicola strongylocentroti TaxID=1795355 RepID=A0A2Z4IH47_9BACT|nr:DUF4876 domain-containing protein [Echinicola strongylocentroti]AWW30255.1 DUF4876 domain-containing protein [Echinicola strongylocentroti]
MKKSLLLLLAVATIFSACNQDDEPTVQPVDLTIQVLVDESLGGEPMRGTEVTLTNVTSTQNYSATTDADGTVQFEALPSGTYDVVAVRSFTDEEFSEYFGYSSEEAEVVFNASSPSLAVNAQTSSPVMLTLASGKIGDLLIKQVYFAGSDVREGALYRDQFIEIYNNSNTTIYADGLYVMGAYGKNNTKESDYDQDNGQYDWNQSIGMAATGDPNNDYFYTRWLYQVPGNGEDYPLEPGESIVIAQSAQNHKSPFTDSDGETIAVQDPSLTVDLSGADFEVYVGDQVDKPLPSDIDNPNVENMIPHYIFGKDFLLDSPGRDSYLIFRMDEDVTTLPSYPDPTDREIDEETNLRIQVPKEYVIDGVEIQRAPTNLIPKKLTTDVDASYTYVPGGSYSSQSVIRKTASIVNERIVLKDTNNSSEDFTFLERAAPKAFAN